MKLRASMVKILWNFTSEKRCVDGKGVIFEVEKIEEVKTHKENETLGVEKEGVEWATFTHYRELEVDNKIRQIAFRIEECDWFYDNTDKNLTLEICSQYEEESSAVYLEYDKNTGYWYEPAYYIFKAGEWRLNNESKLSPAGIMGAGCFRVKVKSRDGKFEHLSPNINVLPSAISLEHYEEMLRELLFIRDDLVINKDSKVTINTTQEYVLYKINKTLDEIDIYLNRINKNPKVNLIKEWEKRSNHSIKKMSSKTLREKILKSYSNKFIVPVYRDSLDIYENQMIKYALHSLKNKVDFYKEHYFKLKKNRYIEYKKELDEAYSTYKWDKNKLDEHINESKNNVINSKIVLDNFINNIQYFENIKPYNLCNNDNEVEIILRISSTFRDNKFCIVNADISTNIKTDGYNNGRFNIEIIRYFLGYREYLAVGKKVSITLTNRNISQHIFLCESLCNNGIVNIKGNYIKVPRVEQNQRGFKDYLFELNNIISINNEEIPILDKDELIEKSLKWFSNSEVKRANNLINLEEEKIGFIQVMKNKTKKLNLVGADIKSKQEEWQECSLKIEKLLNIDFINKVSLKKVNFKSSQIFANDKNYSKIFKNLMKLKENNLIYDSLGENLVLVRDTQNIYEYWCLFKMINLFMNIQGWKLKNSSSIVQELNKYLNKKGSSKIEGFTAELEHSLKTYLGCKSRTIELEILFNKRLNTNIGKFRTPDFTLKFSIENKSCYVYMDAKYRNYSEQGEKQWLRDIEKVAIGKYISEFEETQHPAMVSFIIHSDGNNEKFVNYGGSSINGIKYPVIPNHRYGSVELLPNRSFDFLMLIRMIEEYHLKLYWTCWNCGESKNISIEKKETVSGFPKYHCICQNCGEFWVRTHCTNGGKYKLIKHLKNYHSTKNDNPWYVHCPGGCD